MSQSNRRMSWVRRASVTGLCLLTALPLMAQTMTDTFKVRMEIQGTCEVLSSSDIDFGSRNAQPGTAERTGAIRVQCSKDLPFAVGLDGGSNTGDVNARAMKGPNGASIPYTLSRDSVTGPNWGTESGSVASGVGAGLGMANEIPLTVHAQAQINGDEPAGVYADTVTVTLTY